MRWEIWALGVVVIVASCAPDDPGGPAGDCSTDADCSGGMRCLTLVEGGYSVCEEPPRWEPATDCAGAEDACCSDADCPSSVQTCVSQRNDYVACGEAIATGVNRCENLEDRCETHDDSTDQDGPNICAPAGAWGENHRHCRRATCRKHTDCTAQQGGVCAPIESECSCGVRDALTCVYPDGGCLAHADCPDGSVCVLRPDIGQSVCRAPDPAACL